MTSEKEVSNEFRLSWDSYFIELTDFVSRRATCNRKNVGAVLVKDNRIIATGYNGSIPGEPHCTESKHDIENNSCIRTVHAEVNAIAQAARLGIATEGATLYCNTQPCWGCFKVIVSAGITEIIYKDQYKSNPRIEECAKRQKIRLRQHTTETNS